MRALRVIAAVWGCLGMLPGCWNSSLCGPWEGGGEPPQYVELAKRDLAAKDYAAALQHCLLAEELDDTLAEAKYCVLLANVGALVQMFDPQIMCLVDCNAGLSPPQYQPAIDIHRNLASFVADLEDRLRYIDAYAAKLAAFEDPTFSLDDFPLDALGMVEGVGMVVEPPRFELNLRGTWDKSEVMLLGAAVNAAQGLLDYLLAHKLVLTSVDFDDSREGIARFLFNNPDLLIAAEDERTRLLGDGAKHKGLKNDFLAALSFTVGRSRDLEHVGPKSGGLVQAIKQSAAAARADAIIQWIDKDGDGHPEKIKVPALVDDAAMLRKGDLIVWEAAETQNPFSAESWRRLIALGKALRDNIELGSTPVALRGALQALADDLRALDPNLRITQRPVPDVVALDFGTFVKSPPYLSELLPYYFTFTTAATTAARYGLAVELESYDAETGESFVQKGGYEAYRGAIGDFAHFRYVTPDEFAAGVTVVVYTFSQMSVPLELAADGVAADEKSPALFYVAMQDPSAGRLLAIDPTGQGAFAFPDNAAFNETLVNLVKYYCLDLTKGMPETLRESAYVLGNKIADCSSKFDRE